MGKKRISSKYRNYLKSNKWREFKESIFNVRGYSCEECKSKSNLHIHHLHYMNIFNERPEDVKILCSKCHAKVHDIPFRATSKFLKSFRKKRKRVYRNLKKLI